MMPADFCRKSDGHPHLTLPRRMLSSAVLSPEKKDSLADKTAGTAGIDDDVRGGEDAVKSSAAAVASHGLISLMGRRRSMEDAVTALSTLFPPELPQSPGGRHRFFAVYGGSVAAGMCKERLHHFVAEEIAGGGWTGSVVEWEKVMRMSFARMGKEVCERNAAALEIGEGRRKEEGEMTVVVVSAEELVVANCGDTRAVLCRGGVAVPLSPDHKATSPSQLDEPDETEEVETADGGVMDSCVPPRLPADVDHYLRPDVIFIPEVTVWPRTPSDDFLILASKGMWDVLPNDTARELVKRFLVHEQGSPTRRTLLDESSCADNSAAYAAAMLAEMAVARGSKDNVSVIVVMLTS